jgi:hypothetical protein
VRSVAHQALDEDGDMVADATGAQDQILRRHPAVTLMRLGHVFADGRMPAAGAASGMEGNALMVVEDLHHPMGQPHIDRLPIKRWGTE